MKRIVAIIVCIALCGITLAQKKDFCETRVFKGKMYPEGASPQEITISFLVLKNNLAVGSFRYDTCAYEYQITGQMHKNNRLAFSERNDKDSIIGYLEGRLEHSNQFISGTHLDVNTKQVCGFVVQRAYNTSYWDYIKKNRSLKEYTDIDKALKHPHKVLSIDVARQGISSLPDEMQMLDKIVSINLLGNEFDTFPSILSKLTTLDELSLSTTHLKYIGPEIGQLTNLRLFYANYNGLNEIPKEIGNLTNLLYLELGNNNLHTLPEEIKNLTNLQKLHLDGNPISAEEAQRIREWLPKCVIHF